jgi:3-deoxy-D-manno-octulosonic-acid transferase
MPQSPHIWIYAADPSHVNAAAFLASRLQTQATAQIHLAGCRETAPKRADLNGVICHSDILTAVDLITRINAGGPSSLVWFGPPNFSGISDFPPNASGCILFCNLGQADIPNKRLGLFQTHAERLIKKATDLYTTSQSAAERLLKVGIDADKIHAVGALQTAGSVPTVLGDADEFTALKGRSQWSAVNIHKSELLSVLLAHKAILRESHRMLLILSPSDARDEPDFKSAISEMGLRVARRLDDEIPDNNTAVLLADGPDEYARWLSMAPVCFLGCSLMPEHRGSDPMPAASLGSAVLYGPHIADYLGDYGQLATAGAARIVRDADSLATAVLQVSNPQLAAQMGYAAWNLVSTGAEATDAVISRLQKWIKGLKR